MRWSDIPSSASRALAAVGVCAQQEEASADCSLAAGRHAAASQLQGEPWKMKTVLPSQSAGPEPWSAWASQVPRETRDTSYQVERRSRSPPADVRKAARLP